MIIKARQSLQIEGNVFVKTTNIYLKEKINRPTFDLRNINSGFKSEVNYFNDKHVSWEQMQEHQYNLQVMNLNAIKITIFVHLKYF